MDDEASHISYLRVRDRFGRFWVRTSDSGAAWELEDAIERGSFEPESWTRVCEFGPLEELYAMGDGERTGPDP